MSILDENTCRLAFAPSEFVALGEKLEKFESLEAAKRKAEGQKAGKARHGQLTGNLPPSCDTRDAVAKTVGVSGKTYETAKKIKAF